MQPLCVETVQESMDEYYKLLRLLVGFEHSEAVRNIFVWQNGGVEGTGHITVDVEHHFWLNLKRERSKLNAVVAIAFS